MAEGTGIAAVVMMLTMQIHSDELQVQLLTNINVSPTNPAGRPCT